jgi:hypothetical protein
MRPPHRDGADQHGQAPKPERNDPCHCRSGNKYKKCCLAKDQAAERAAMDRLQIAEFKAAVAPRLAGAEAEDADEDALDAASNAVVDLVRAATLDEAEAAARDLLRCFPAGTASERSMRPAAIIDRQPIVIAE